MRERGVEDRERDGGGGGQREMGGRGKKGEREINTPFLCFVLLLVTTVHVSTTYVHHFPTTAA